MAICKIAFEGLLRSSQSFQSMSHNIPVAFNNPHKRKSTPDAYSQQLAAEPAHKRRQPGTLDIIPGTRELAPKPYDGSLSPMGMGAKATATGRKRGRPSKQEQAKRQAELIASGDILPPVNLLQTQVEETGSYASIAPNPSMLASGSGPFVTNTITSDVQQIPPGDSPGKKKRKGPVKPRVSSISVWSTIRNTEELQPLQMLEGQGSFHILPPIDQSREYERPHQSHTPATNTPLGPIPNLTSSPYATKSEPPASAGPRPET